MDKNQIYKLESVKFSEKTKAYGILASVKDDTGKYTEPFWITISEPVFKYARDKPINSLFKIKDMMDKTVIMLDFISGGTESVDTPKAKDTLSDKIERMAVCKIAAALYLSGEYEKDSFIEVCQKVKKIVDGGF
jgi:hypothetical protein